MSPLVIERKAPVSEDAVHRFASWRFLILVVVSGQR
jgi:hypothetical protein